MSEEIRKRDERGVRIMGAYAKKYQKSDDCIGDMNDLDALLTVSIEQLGERKAGDCQVFRTIRKAWRLCVGNTTIFSIYR